MFIRGGPDKRIKHPFVRKITYPIAVFLLALFAVPMTYGLFGIVGLFILIPGFAVTFIWAIKRGGFPPPI
jgi:lipopolysaccharide export LptBFGC system permease protein LptF